jgi:NAD(P)-dependent dehydrogenase (short-subunit alcohol dehydrogenase family)
MLSRGQSPKAKKFDKDGLMMGRLAGKTAIVTGGASGIGKAAAELFAAEGARVVIADVNDDLGGAVADSLGPEVMFKHTDLTSEADIRACIDYAVQSTGRLDIVVNNAGIADPAMRPSEVDASGFDGVAKVLLLAPMLMIKYASRVMKGAESGCIINVTSATGIDISIEYPVYATCKAGLIHYTELAALELAPRGIRVNAVCPGGVVTPLMLKTIGIDDSTDQNVATASELLLSIQPIKKLIQPKDVANAMLFLASEDARMITGQNIVVDAGYLIGRNMRDN